MSRSKDYKSRSAESKCTFILTRCLWQIISCPTYYFYTRIYFMFECKFYLMHFIFGIKIVMSSSVDLKITLCTMVRFVWNLWQNSAHTFSFQTMKKFSFQKLEYYNIISNFLMTVVPIRLLITIFISESSARTHPSNWLIDWLID